MLTTYYLLPTTYYLLLTTYYWLLTTYYLLLTTYYKLLVRGEAFRLLDIEGLETTPNCLTGCRPCLQCGQIRDEN